MCFMLLDWIIWGLLGVLNLSKRNWLAIVWRQSCPPSPASTQVHHFLINLCDSGKNFYIGFFWFTWTGLYHSFFVKKDHLMCRILCEKNGREDGHAHSLRCLVLKAALLWALPSHAPPHLSSLWGSPLHHCACHGVSFPHKCLPQTTASFYAEGLFQSFPISCLVLWDQMLHCHVVTIRVSLWSLTTCLKLELAIFHLRTCSWIESYKLL